MLNNLLADQNQNQSSIIFLVVLGAILIAFMVYNFISGNKRKKQMQEEQAKRNDIHPGYKVTTIGGIIGTVVSVDEAENSFVLMTGGVENPSFLKFDKQAIYTSENPFALADNADESAASPEAEAENADEPKEAENAEEPNAEDSADKEEKAE